MKRNNEEWLTSLDILPVKKMVMHLLSKVKVIFILEARGTPSLSLVWSH